MKTLHNTLNSLPHSCRPAMFRKKENAIDCWTGSLPSQDNNDNDFPNHYTYILCMCIMLFESWILCYLNHGYLNQ